MKHIQNILWTVLCFVVALIPETAMVLLWGSINPVTALEKIIMLGFFWFAGAGLCALFAYGAFMMWVIGLKK